MGFGGRPALDERLGGRFDQGEELDAVGSEFGIEGKHQLLLFCRSYFVFGVDWADVVVHPCTIENEGAVTGIGYVAVRDRGCEKRADDSDDWCLVRTAQSQKKGIFETILLALSFVKSE